MGGTEPQLQGSGGCVQGRVQTAEVLGELQSSGLLDDLPDLRPYRSALR